MRTILQNITTFTPFDQESSNLKHRTQSQFELIDEKLYKKSDIRHPTPRFVVQKSEAFDIIAEEHLKLLHAGRNKLYPLKSKHAEPIADCFALFIAAFLPPKIMQADNGKEFKGALLILLLKQANGVVEAKLRAWKMDHGSTEWKDGLLEVTLAMNTQIHSTIGCAPAELLFRDRSSHIKWLNSQARKDLSIRVEQEEPNLGPIFESELEPRAQIDPRIDPRLYNSELNLELNSEPSSGSELNSELSIKLRARAPTRASASQAAGLNSEPSLGSELNSELSIKLRAQLQAQPELELNSELRARAPTRAQARAQARAPTRAQARAQARAQSRAQLRIELRSPKLNSEPGPELELNSELQARAPTRAQARAQSRAQLRMELQRRPPELNSEPGPELELNSELRAQARAQSRAQLRPEPEL
ncbi:hypothetical protein V492_00720 [Pseudogymnoascus sp. VKM F-4246]|nr:hypothetical protein V492_00720 [Pseudogymnoascus sp. VKM F-4246]